MAKDLDYYLAQARRIAEHREAGAEKELRKLYKGMLKDLQQFIATISDSRSFFRSSSFRRSF